MARKGTRRARSKRSVREVFKTSRTLRLLRALRVPLRAIGPFLYLSQRFRKKVLVEKSGGLLFFTL